jgi:hypothetical protein
MIVFDLKCATGGHVFEAWFGSTAAFEDQRARKLVSCPLCGDLDVSKAVMSPNVAAKSSQRSRTALVPLAKPDERGDAETKALIETMAKAQTKMLETSEWVGRDFDAKARAMDAGEIDHGRIHGEVSRAEAKALIEDGVGVMPLPFPVIAPEKQN